MTRFRSRRPPPHSRVQSDLTAFFEAQTFEESLSQTESNWVTGSIQRKPLCFHCASTALRMMFMFCLVHCWSYCCTHLHPRDAELAMILATWCHPHLIKMIPSWFMVRSSLRPLPKRPWTCSSVLWWCKNQREQITVTAAVATPGHNKNKPCLSCLRLRLTQGALLACVGCLPTPATMFQTARRFKLGFGVGTSYQTGAVPVILKSHSIECRKENSWMTLFTDATVSQGLSAEVTCKRPTFWYLAN